MVLAEEHSIDFHRNIVGKKGEKEADVRRDWRKPTDFMGIEQKVREPYISKCVKKVCGLDFFLTREEERTERSS